MALKTRADSFLKAVNSTALPPMEYALRLNIGAVTFSLKLPSQAIHTALRARYEHYINARTPDWTVTLTLKGEPGSRPAPWISHDETRTYFRMESHSGWVDFAQKQAQVATPALSPPHPAVERVLSYICMQELPRSGAGLLLHGVGIVINDTGYIFFGASGRGKSTVARLAEGVGEVLTDENVIVRFTERGPAVESTPFWGTGTPTEQVRAAAARRVPLKALHALHHAPSFICERLTPGAAVMELLASEKVATERASSARAWLAAAERLLQQVPLYRLGFRPTADLWTFLGLRKSPKPAKGAV